MPLHAPSNVGGYGYAYDANGNVLTGGFRTYGWNAENQPTAIQGTDGYWESYTYDADGGRASKVRGGGPQTVYLFNGLVEVQEGTSTTRTQYTFNGRVVAQRTLTSTNNTVVYLHGDHLGSTLILSRQDGTYAGQWYTPWGDRRTPPAITETSREYTGQKRDDTGLLFYNARYYDPVLARFVSPDTIVPGTSAGSGGAAATVGSGSTSSLTVDFHEGGFVSQLNAVNAQRIGQGFWFELSEQQRQQAEGPNGPANPQALNRYSYVLNNPLRYTDPTGHDHVKEGNHSASYEQVCANGGRYVDCHSPGANEVYDEKGNALWKTCVKKECEYIWGGTDLFNNFKSAVDDMMDYLEAGGWALAETYLAVGGTAAACVPTAGLGCVAAAGAWALGSAATLYFLGQADKAFAQARTRFSAIRNWNRDNNKSYPPPPRRGTGGGR